MYGQFLQEGYPSNIYYNRQQYLPTGTDRANGTAHRSVLNTYSADISSASGTTASPIFSSKLSKTVPFTCPDQEEDYDEDYIDPWNTISKYENKVPFDTITTGAGETIVCYQEAAPPPPTTTKGVIYDKDRLLLPNHRLISAQGYDIHAPERHKKEVYAPAPVKEKSSWQISNEMREEAMFRAQAQIALNKNGELPFLEQHRKVHLLVMKRLERHYYSTY